MIQVLLKISGSRPTPPALMWMTDDTKLGDTFIWRRRVCTVTAIYGTRLPNHQGCCADFTDRPRKNHQANVTLDNPS